MKRMFPLLVTALALWSVPLAHAGLYEDAKQSLRMDVPQADMSGVSIHGGVHVQTGQSPQSQTIFRARTTTGGSCGNFDFRGSMKQTLDEVPEMLTALVMDIGQQIPMLALCYNWPTLCASLQHWQGVLSGLVSAKYAQCQAIQNAMAYGGLRLHGGAISQCLEEKADGGTPLDQAMRECHTELTMVRRPDGSTGENVNLVADTLGAFGASAETQTLANELLGEVTVQVGQGRLSAQARQPRGAHLARFESHRREAAEALRIAVQEYQETGEVSMQTLRDASTPGQALPLVVVEALAAAKADPVTYENGLGKISTRQAIVRLTWECHDVEDQLQAAISGTTHLTDEAKRLLEQRVKDSQRTLAQMVHKVEAEERLQPVFDDLLRQHAGMMNAATRAGLNTPTLTYRPGSYGTQTSFGYSR